MQPTTSLAVAPWRPQVAALNSRRQSRGTRASFGRMESQTCRKHGLLPLPAKRLLDSHILEPQVNPIFDALEVFEAPAHHLRSRFAVVSGPSAEASDDPRGISKGTFRMGVLLLGCFSLKLRRYCFKNRLVLGGECVSKLLSGCTITRFDELHDCNGIDRCSRYEFDHDLRIADVGRFDVEPGCLERVEVFLDGPAHAIETDNSAR